jgi:protoheme IX farnesyltransferase
VIKEITVLLELTKFRISLFSTFSASAGFILAKQEITLEIIVPILGVFFLACGSCALNQYQERKPDRLMDRTRGRPLPSGRLSSGVCLLISLSFMLLGSAILFNGPNLIAWGLGLFAILWYNGVYTHLKRKTPFAGIPGAMIGGIPPLIGWASGGGDILDPKILVISFFFFMWQVPHFWFLLLNFGRDYEKAGFPSLTQLFTSAQLRRMTFIWVFSTAVACMIIPLFGIIRSHFISGSLFVIGFWLVWKTYRILITRSQELPFRFNFKLINTYLLMVMFLFAIDQLIQTH